MNDADIEIIDTDYHGLKDNSKSQSFLTLMINKAFNNKEKLEELLYKSQSFLELVKSSVPKDAYQAILTNEQKKGLSDGTIKLMNSKGSLLANIVDPKTNKIISNINLEKVSLSNDIDNAIFNYNNKLQMAQIAKEIEDIKITVNEIKTGQENDRLAIAYSCEQKLIQALEIKDDDARRNALLSIAHSAEDCRQKLALSQQEEIKYINDRSLDLFGKVKEFKFNVNMDKRMEDLRKNMKAFNIASYAEVLAYQEMGEDATAKKTLQYYGDFLNNTYLKNEELIERLDSLDSSRDKYWSRKLPCVYKNIKELKMDEKIMLEERK